MDIKCTFCYGVYLLNKSNGMRFRILKGATILLILKLNMLCAGLGCFLL